MGNIGATEIILILIIALVVFGPRRLPEIGKTVGKSLREFRKASQDLRDEFQFSLDDDEPPMVRSQSRPGPKRRPEIKEAGAEGQVPVTEAKSPVTEAKSPVTKAKSPGAKAKSPGAKAKSGATKARRPGAPASGPRTRRPTKATAKKPERPA